MSCVAHVKAVSGGEKKTFFFPGNGLGTTVDVCARNSVMCVRSTLLKECGVRIQSSIRYAHVAVPCRNNTPMETTVLCRICLHSVLQ